MMSALNLGGSFEGLPNGARIAELAVDKQAQTLLVPVTALLRNLWTKVSIEFFKDARDAVFKSRK